MKKIGDFIDSLEQNDYSGEKHKNMYLQNLKTRYPLPFFYSMSYDAENHAIQFAINPVCSIFFKKISPKNLYLKYCREKLGFSDFEPNIEKNFGWHNCSVNHGLVDGLITLSFPIKAKYTPSDVKCGFCKEEVMIQTNIPCYTCRDTGLQFIETTNIDAICASLYILTKYFSSCLVLNNLDMPLENKWGYQDIWLELDPRAGIYGECSRRFLEKIATFASEEDARNEEMFDAYNYIIGKHLFPEFDFYQKVYQFRSDIRNVGNFYIEVPGVNGCSIYMSHSSDTEFTCHSIDSTKQQLTLLIGFASIAGKFYKQKEAVLNTR